MIQHFAFFRLSLLILFASVLFVGCGIKSTTINTDTINASSKINISEPEVNTINNATTNTNVATNTNQNANSATETNAMTSSPQVRDITLTAKQFQFDPSTITVHKGDTVNLHIRSIDTAHGLSIPAFNVNANILPNKTTNITFIADKTGTFTFSCSVICGSGHTNMQGTLIVQ